MNVNAVLRVLIALCIALEIRPEDLAAVFEGADAIQEYYDRLLECVQANGQS